MASEVPFLGCKISLISKCDIRYEGILYSVDAKESTIALSKVRSFGTEDRATEQGFIPIKDDVYEYIIFRASDVKDLRVDAPEPPGLSDPAIIRASVPAASSNSAYASSSSQLNANGSLAANSGSSSSQHQKPLLPFTMPSRNSDQRQEPPGSLPNVMPPIISNTGSVKSNQNRANAVTSILSSTSNKTSHAPGSTKNHPVPYSSTNQHQQRRRGDSRKDGSRDSTSRRDDNRDYRRDDNRRVDRRNRDDYRRPEGRRDDRDRGDMRRNDRRPSRNGRRIQDDRSGGRAPAKGDYDSDSRRYDSYSRRNQSTKGPFRREDRRPRSGERRGPPRGRRTDPLKFDQEYDFDRANKEFLELEGKLKDLKIKQDEDRDGGESVGEGAGSKSTTGASESGSGYDSDEHKDEDSKDGFGEGANEYYDKSKSFFDNIGCEAVQRSQGKTNKPDWRKERQLNAETFGVSANYRRGFRGRARGSNGYRR